MSVRTNTSRLSDLPVGPPLATLVVVLAGLASACDAPGPDAVSPENGDEEATAAKEPAPVDSNEQTQAAARGPRDDEKRRPTAPTADEEKCRPEIAPKLRKAACGSRTASSSSRDTTKRSSGSGSWDSMATRRNWCAHDVLFIANGDV